MYNCDICGHSTIHKNCLRSHIMSVHLDIRPFKCPYCPRRFINQCFLKRHQPIHTGGHMKNNRCDICGYSTNDKKALRNHIMRVHFDFRPFKCPHCPRRFVQPSDLERHIPVHTGGEIKKICCDICGKKFISKSKHLLGKHFISTHSNIRQFCCSFCGKGFPAKRNMLRHEKLHSKTQNKDDFCCDICGRVFTSKYVLINHLMAVHFGVAEKCSVCLKSFIRKDTLKQHSLIHSKSLKDRLCCDLCGKLFKSKGDLHFHFLAVHFKLHLFKCPICQKTFPKKLKLQKHVIFHDIPEKENSFICDICGMTFKQYHKANIGRHIMLAHFGIRPFQCTFCSKSYAMDNHLKRHVIVNHKNDTFCCDVCDKSFPGLDALKTHVKSGIHFNKNTKLFHCSACSSKFTVKQNLMQHQCTS